MIRLFVITLFCLLFSASTSKKSFPDTIKIGIFSGYKIDGFTFSVLEGSYNVYNNNGKIIATIQPFDHITIEKSNNRIKLGFDGKHLLTNDKIDIKGKSFRNTFAINPLNDSIEFRYYDDDLIIINAANKLTIINHVPFENYIAGVVQSESGFGRHPEYYKLQATISRTYAVKNLNRHINEGFNLCDEVHCQAYYRKTLYPDIIFATEYTRGDIIIDENGEPINTVFHANCGGMTVNSENVWINSSSYLKSVADTFCHDMPGATWKKTISRDSLYQYLQLNLGTILNDSISESVFNLIQEQRMFFLDPYNKIPLTRFRIDFGLRSTYFDMTPVGDSILLNGRGYGHGVGLCQEGAMQMAKQGVSRDSIIKFYYKNAILKVSENH